MEENIKNKLIQYKQEHLIDYYEKLEENKKQEFLNQILEIDFEQIKNLFSNALEKKDNKQIEIETIDSIDKDKIGEEEKNKYSKIGEDIIKQGKYAIVTMAGGQGTRLGYNGPKGAYFLDEGINKSIFELLCENLKNAYEKYKVYIPWYLMTSKENNKQTIEFFERNNYFGYNKEYIKFFIQGELPMIDTEGKVIIDENEKIKQASDGHGGIFISMKKNGIIEDMKKRDIQWIYISGVDNILAKLVDEIFIGLAIDKKVLVVGKSVIKAYPEEKVGIFCKKNGRPTVIEYSEMSKEMSEEKGQNNELKYCESHILCNLFNIKAIELISENNLPYHSAYKKCNYINKEGKLIISDSPNAYKFETFLFDAFEKLEDMLILRVKREEEFAPIKNESGKDSPKTAKELYKKYHRIGE